MANKDFTFVEETDSDNGYDWVSGALRFGEVDVPSVKAMVDHILANLGKGDCIESITIIGHGCPGYISVGNGQSGTDASKGIGLWNRAQWTAQLRRLRCRFCPDSEVYLRGCNVGADEEGAQLLFEIRQVLGCASSVQAPTGVCNPAFTTGDDQDSKSSQKAKPKAIANPDDTSKKKKGKKKGKGAKGGLSGTVTAPVGLLAGPDLESLEAFAPRQILAARYLPAYPGRPFGPDHLDGPDARCLGNRLVRRLIGELGEAEALSMPEAGFALQGLLQLQILDRSGARRWLSPWAMTGNGDYMSVMGGDTRLVYRLPDHVAKSLRAYHRRRMDELFAEASCEEGPVQSGVGEIGSVRRVEGVDAGFAQRLEAAGIGSLRALAGVDVAEVKVQGVSRKRLASWRAQAALLEADPALDSNGAELLVRGLGIDSAEALRTARPTLTAAALKKAAKEVTLPAGYDVGALAARLRSGS